MPPNIPFPREALDYCFQNAPVIFYLCEAGKTFHKLYISPNASTLLGVPQENLQQDDGFWLDRIHPDDRPPVLEHFARGNGEAVEYRFRTAEGHYRWLRDELSPAQPEAEAPLKGYVYDITLHKEQELRLQNTHALLAAKEDMLQDLLDHLPQHLFWKDANGIFQGCNRSGALTLGLDSPRDIVGKTDFDLYPDPSLADYLHNRDMEVMQRCAPLSQIVYQPPSSGQERWLDVTKASLCGSDGRSHGVLISYMDVTERMRAEESLRQFKLAVEQSSNTIFITDTAGIIRYVNPRFQAIYGYAPEEVLGSKASLLKSGHTRPEEYQALWKTLQAGKSWHGEFLNRSKNGSLTWQVATISPLLDEDGRISRFIAIEDDISDQKRIEGTLRESEEKFRSLVEDVNLIAYESDPATFRCTYVSPQAEAILGFPLQAWYEDNFWANHLHPEDRDRAVNFCHTATLAGRDHRFEYRMIAADGREVWFDDPVRVFTDDEGKPKLMRGVMIDISERKAMEIALRDSEERFRRLAEVSEEGIIFHDGKQVLDANPVFAQLFGYSPDEAMGLDLAEFTTPESYSRIRNAVRRNRSSPYEIVGRRKDGSLFQIEIIGKAIPLDGKKVQVAALRDISRCKLLEQNLLRLSRQHTTLSHINHLIVFSREEATLFREACRILVETGHFKGAWIGLIDKESRQVKSVAHWGPRDYIKRLRISLDPDSLSAQGPTGHAVMEGQPYVCNDFSADPRTAPWQDLARKAGIQGGASYPLRRNGEVIGAISVYADRSGSFDEACTALLKEITDNLNFALDKFDQELHRKIAEKSLHEGEARFRAIANYTYNWENWVDPAGRLRWVNPAVERFTGYTPEECYAMENYPLPLVHKDDRQRIQADFMRALAGEGGSVTEFRFLHKDGTVRWGTVDWQNIYDAAGHPLGHRSSVRDITEQKRAMERLFNTQQMLQLVLDHIPQRIYWKDLDCVYRGGNRAYLNDLGLDDIAQLENHTDFDFVPAEEARIFQAYDQVVINRGEALLGQEEFATLPNNKQCWLLTNKVPILDADQAVIGVLGAYTDITELKQTQQQLHDTLRELQTILDNAQIGIALVRDRHFVWINRHMQEMFGYPLQEIQGKPSSLLYVTKEDYQELGQSAYSLLYQGKPFENERTMKRRDGSVFWCHIRGSAIDLDNPSQEAIWIILDIDRLKRAETELRELNDTLEQRVTEQTAQNIEQERLLIQQSRHAAMGEMIGNIAHQWRQPLSVLGLVLQNIQLDFQEGSLDAPTMENYVVKANAMVQRMSATIEDFRNFFRPGRKQDYYNIMESIRESLSLMEASLKNNNIAVTIEGPEKIISWGLANEFAQIMLNLIGNAKDALVERKTDEGHIGIQVEETPEKAIITVQDNGGGIPPEIGEKIFDPYFTTKASGTGIGLYMVKTILEKHMGGRIDFHNTGEGARFVVTLPRATEPKP